MDYIREELLRQQALLVVLLTGQRPEPSQERREQNTVSRPEHYPEFSGMNRSRRREAGAGSDPLFLKDDAAETAALWAALDGGSTRRQMAEMEAAAAGRPRQGVQSLGEQTAGTVGPEYLGPGAQTIPSFGSRPAEDREVRLVTEVHRTEDQAPSDPEALSRAFQRDARRYDGGFRLY